MKGKIILELPMGDRFAILSGKRICFTQDHLYSDKQCENEIDDPKVGDTVYFIDDEYSITLKTFDRLYNSIWLGQYFMSKIKFSNLNAAQRKELSNWLEDRIHEMEIDEDFIADEYGDWFMPALRGLARYVRNAKRSESGKS